MNSPRRYPTKLRLRLVVSLPALVCLFMVVAGLWTYWIFPQTFLPREFTAEAFQQAIGLWTLFMVGLAFCGNFVAGLIISRHLNRLMLKVEATTGRKRDPLPEIQARSEMDALGIVLDEATTTLGRFVTDSYILDSLPDAVITVDPSLRIVRVNDNAAKLLRTKAEEAVGRSLKRYILDNASGRRFYQMVDQGLKAGDYPMTVASFSVNDGDCREYWVAIHPARGKWRESAGACVSISIKDQASILAVKNQLEKIERLAAVGRVASGIAHEVRNPLGAIRTFTELIQEDLSKDDSRLDYAAEILKQISRLDRLIEDVLGFSRDPVATIKNADLRELLSRTVLLARSRFPGVKVDFSETYAHGLPEVRCDPDKLSQAFLNLFINAIEACGDGGKIAVEAVVHTFDETDGKTICVTVNDNGPGVSSEHLGKIFNPFFTTKLHGTGLGLATTHTIVTAHGGTIELLSEHGRGTSFFVFLPEKHHFCTVDSNDTWSAAANV